MADCAIRLTFKISLKQMQAGHPQAASDTSDNLSPMPRVMTRASGHSHFLMLILSVLCNFHRGPIAFQTRNLMQCLQTSATAVFAFTKALFQGWHVESGAQYLLMQMIRTGQSLALTRHWYCKGHSHLLCWLAVLTDDDGLRSAACVLIARTAT